MKEKENPFKEKIKIAMLKKGLNQTQMANKLGITNQAFSKWLSDCPNPKLETLKRVAKILGVSGMYFFENSGNIADNNSTINVNSTSENMRLTLLEKDLQILKQKVEILELKLGKTK